MARTSAAHETTFKNTSGATRHFAFLGPHGKTLAADAEVSFLGNPMDVMHSFGPGTGSQRRLEALKRALIAGYLEIVKTPTPVLYDETLDQSKQLKLDNDKLYAADPSWLLTSSSTSL